MAGVFTICLSLSSIKVMKNIANMLHGLFNVPIEGNKK